MITSDMECTSTVGPLATSSSALLGQGRSARDLSPAAAGSRSRSIRAEEGLSVNAQSTAPSPARQPPRTTLPSAAGKVSLSPGLIRRSQFAGVGVGAGGFIFFGSGCGAARAAGTAERQPAPKPGLGWKKGPKRILILMSATGGGHKASAQALKAGFETLYGKKKYEIDIVDAWKDHTPFPYNQLPKTYGFLVKHGFLWRSGYYLTQPRIMHTPSMRMAHLFTRRRINSMYERYRPDLVVSVHPLLQHVPIRVLQNRIRQGVHPSIHFTTVVTDFTTCHNSWFHRGVRQCFVPTPECKRRAQRMGLKEFQITMHGLPIRPAFARPLPPRQVLRRRLGMELGTPAVLLVGGGEGMGRLEQTVSALSKRVGRKCQVVVICGRNQKLAAKLRKKDTGGMKIHVKGFVDNMHEWMGACDTIVTKAGPGTIAEALIAGIPVLLNGHVPGQEAGNIPYVVDNKVGAFERCPHKIADTIQRWFTTERKELDAMHRRAKELGKPDALFKIVRDLSALCA